MWKRLLLLVTALSLSACVTNGKDFPSDVGWIKPGNTKRDDVKMLLGTPYSVGNSGGRPTWTYGYYRHKLIGKSSTKELKFYWNEDGTVSHFSFNSSFPGDTDHASSPGAQPAPGG